MHVSPLIHHRRQSYGALITAALLLIGVSAPVMADPVYVTQVPNIPVTDVPLMPLAHHGSGQANWHAARGQSGSLPPEAIASTKQNLAQSYQIGSYNSAFHLQSGVNNSSTVGVIGAQNNVAVLQSGNDLRSNVVLLGTVGLNVDVLQPKGSAPVNLLVARLPGGGLLIKR
jgi:hypothetical protein